MHLIATHRTGLGILNSDPENNFMLRRSPVIARPYWGQPQNPAAPGIMPTGATQSATSVPVIGSTSMDAAGNVYTYTTAGWQLTTPVASATVPSTAATATPSSTVGFPTNPVAGQTYTDSLGNLYTYGATGWALTTAAGASSSWLTQYTIFSSVPNYAVIAGALVGALILMKGFGGKR